MFICIEVLLKAYQSYSKLSAIELIFSHIVNITLNRIFFKHEINKWMTFTSYIFEIGRVFTEIVENLFVTIIFSPYLFL